MRPIRVYIVPAAVGLIIFTLTSLGLSQTAPSQPSLAKLSDKDLFKRADAEDKAGRLDNAREAILLVVQRAIEKKKKPDKKYQDLLDSLNTRLANREAASGADACSRMDLETCQKQLAAAKKFATTPNVSQLEDSFDKALAGLKQNLQSASATADGGDPEAALDKLAGLAKFEAYLPSIKAETERVRSLFLQKLVDEGRSLINQKRWDDASARFQRVLSVSPNNEQAKAGLERLEQGRRAYLLSSQAADQLKARHYDEAFRSIGAALNTYPEAKGEFEAAQKQITQAWLTYLLADIPSLLENQDDLQKSREAYLRLQKVLEVAPENADATNLLEKAKQVFVPNSVQYAQKLVDIKDLSRIATATILKYDVQRMMPDLVPQEELKSAMGNFNRKRISQLVVSVEDLASASPDFTRSIQALTRNIMDKQGLRDLRIRSKDDYEKSPNDDLQYQYLLPDGKSYTATLTVNIRGYEFRRSPTTSDEKSKYVFGSERVPNPDYEPLSKQLTEIRRALDNPSRKKDKPTREGWTENTYALKKSELERTDKLIEKDKIVEYTYQKTQYKQNTDVEIEITLRDYYSKDQIAEKLIPYHVELNGIEISGVKDKDVNGIQNQTLRLPDKDQGLSEGARAGREQLDKWLPQLLHSYTDRFFNEGERALKAGRVDDAVEAYLCHWAFFGGRLDPAQMDRISETVKNATAFDLKKYGDKLMTELLKVMVVQ